MKVNKVLALALLSLGVGIAGAQARTAKKPEPSRGKSRLGTSFKFDGTALHGKYQKTPGTTVTVENDKFLEDLLGPRTSFADRDEKDRQRN